MQKSPHKREQYDLYELYLGLLQIHEKTEVHYFADLDSTNDYLVNLAPEIEVKRAVCLCETQNKGRGRMNRKWENWGEEQITVSYLVKSNQKIEQFQLLSIAITLECLFALEKLGFKPLKVKWPNDLYYESQKLKQAKKLAGVLIDTKTSWNRKDQNQSTTEFIIGLGLNFKGASGENTDHSFGHLAELNQAKVELMNKTELVIELIAAMERAIESLSSGQSQRYVKAFGQHDWFSNQTIVFQLPNGKCIVGHNRGIDASGSLLIESEGRVQAFLQGQIKMGELP